MKLRVIPPMENEIQQKSKILFR